MRLFVAIELPQPVKDQISCWWENTQAHLESDLWRPVSPHLWHMTLAFYGDVAGHDIDDLAEELAECARHHRPINLSLGDYGLFPKPAKPRVFQLGVQEDADEHRLKSLARCCRRAGHTVITNRTAREATFHPHITLARSVTNRQAVDMQRLLMITDAPEINWQAEQFHLYHSVLRAEEPQYQRLESFELNALRWQKRGKYN